VKSPPPENGLEGKTKNLDPSTATAKFLALRTPPSRRDHTTARAPFPKSSVRAVKPSDLPDPSTTDTVMALRHHSAPSSSERPTALAMARALDANQTNQRPEQILKPDRRPRGPQRDLPEAPDNFRNPPFPPKVQPKPRLLSGNSRRLKRPRAPCCPGLLFVFSVATPTTSRGPLVRAPCHIAQAHASPAFSPG
jgi:hypothetical protein